MNKNIKNDFPIFSERGMSQPFVYLDSAAMAHSPVAVLDAVRHHTTKFRSNVHRGIYTLSEEATSAYENARESVRKFLHAGSSCEIIFTRNTTEAINLVAYSFGKNFLHEGDHILLSIAEHHSNFLPWQMLRDEHGIVLDVVSPDEDGMISIDAVRNTLTPRTKLAALFYVSNVLGSINPVADFGKLFRERDIVFVVDAAQAAPHVPIDVSAIGCDFLAFSGYKVGAPTGIGVLYGREELLSRMPPIFRGGSMIQSVSVAGAEWNELPWKFEAGTPNVEGAIGLGAALEYLSGIGFENLRKNENAVLARALGALRKIPGVKIFGPRDIDRRAGVVSFTVNGVHPHDLASLLDRDGICIRVGHHCAMPLHSELGVSATARASFWVYNDSDDVDRFAEGMERAVKILIS